MRPTIKIKSTITIIAKVEKKPPSPVFIFDPLLDGIVLAKKFVFDPAFATLTALLATLTAFAATLFTALIALFFMLFSVLVTVFINPIFGVGLRTLFILYLTIVNNKKFTKIISYYSIIASSYQLNDYLRALQ
jgi:hypothetical protein